MEKIPDYFKYSHAKLGLEMPRLEMRVMVGTTSIVVAICCFSHLLKEEEK